MKNILHFTLFIFLVFSCSSSGNSESKNDQQQAAESSPATTEEASQPNEVVNPAEDVEMIDAELLSAEPRPYNIASYYKFYHKDLAEAERVLSGKEEYLKDQLDTIDSRNGYMSVSFFGEGESSSWQYVYWNLSDGRKLFGVNEIVHDFIGNTYTNFFEFKAFNENKWESFDIGDLADLVADGRSKTVEALQSTDLVSQLFPNDEIAQATSFLLRLPQRGKDIKLTIKRANYATEVDEPMLTVNLKFIDGRFVPQPSTLKRF